MAIKITFLGAGSSVFVRNVLGDCIIHPELEDLTFALYDIDAQRLEDSYLMLHAICAHYGKSVKMEKYVGVEEPTGTHRCQFPDLRDPGWRI